MASFLDPNVYAYKAGAAIALGVAVKFGADDKTVVPCALATDRSIGVSMNVAQLGDRIEVAHPGGGARMLAHGTIAAGKMLVPFTDGSGQQTTAQGDKICAQALQNAVAGDIFSVMVMSQTAQAANE